MTAANWDTIYILALRMRTPEELITLIEAAVASLKCPNCEAHGNTYLLRHPVTGQPGEDYLRYVYEYHSDVRKHQGKPAFRWIDTRERYLNPSPFLRMRSIAASVASTVAGAAYQALFTQPLPAGAHVTAPLRQTPAAVHKGCGCGKH
jgi:hypothetical protein